MYDDYRRTFPFKLIGPIIDAEQLSAGNQLDRRDLSTASRARQGIIGAYAFPKKKGRSTVKSNNIRVDNRFNSSCSCAS
jgi:hypothetical protein